MIGPRKVFSSEISANYIRQFIRLNFSTFAFSFVPRDCNKVTHALAALGSNGQEPQRLWLEAVPDDVSVLLASDLAAPG